MADETGEQQAGDGWPTPKFTFSVKIGEIEGLFAEAIGLEQEIQQIEYRRNNKPGFSVAKIPGIKKAVNVTLKKGIFKSDTALWELYKKTKLGAIERTTIVISLLDENNTVAMSWTLRNADVSMMTDPGNKT